MEPLPFGAGLALGLLMIVGLPRVEAPLHAARPEPGSAAHGADAGVRQTPSVALSMATAIREHRQLTSAGRP